MSMVAVVMKVMILSDCGPCCAVAIEIRPGSAVYLLVMQRVGAKLAGGLFCQVTTVAMTQ